MMIEQHAKVVVVGGGGGAGGNVSIFSDVLFVPPLKGWILYTKGF